MIAHCHCHCVSWLLRGKLFRVITSCLFGAICVAFVYRLLRSQSKLLESARAIIRSNHDDSTGSEEYSECPILHRKYLIDSFCEKHYPGRNELFLNGGFKSSLTLRKLRVDDEHRLILCPVPKAGHTTWREYLQKATGNWHGEFDINKSGTKALGEYRDDQIEYRLKNYFKVMVARHPLDRLVSAYNDKFIEQDYRLHLRAYIIDQVRHGITNISKEEYKKHLEKPEEGVTPLDPIIKAHMANMDRYRDGDENPYKVNFTEFLHYVHSIETDTRNSHWKAINNICDPCQVGYDFVLKMETIKRDSDYVIQKMSEVASVHGYNSLPVTHSLRQVDENQFQVSDSPGIIYKKASLARGDIDYSGINLVAEKPWMLRRLPEYDDVPQSLLDGIAKMYWLDFVLFGYDFNPRDQMMQCSYTLNETSCC